MSDRKNYLPPSKNNRVAQKSRPSGNTTPMMIFGRRTLPPSPPLSTVILVPLQTLNDASRHDIAIPMVDQLINVDSDRGPIEPIPVTIMSGGAEVALGQSPAVTVTRLTSRIVMSAASTNATLIKSSPGYGYIVHGYNNNAAARYLKFYNKATAPTVGTDIPILTFYLSPSDNFTFDLASVRFSAGIGLAITTGAPDADTAAISGGDIMGLNVVYG